jgi:hypothetical protein
MPYLNSFWHVMWTMFWLFAFFAYIVALFSIITDLFRDRELSGWWKALWVIFLFFVPFLTALAYLIFRGRGMSERSDQQWRRDEKQTREYIRDVAGSSPADEITKLQALRDAGSITPEEFQQLKDAALARAGGTTPNAGPATGGMASSTTGGTAQQ